MSAKPRIVLLDIETAPNLGWVWGVWEQDVIELHKHWYILSFSVKELGKRGVRTYALPDYPLFERRKDDDKALVKDLWRVYDEADIVIAHNGDRFDVRKSNARFIAHNLPPPSPYKSIDTLKIARRHFKFDSNRLDALGKYLGVGKKLPHTGKHLWLGCMAGDLASWATMRRYNEQDVALLERVYLKLRPWDTNHPDLTMFSKKTGCPNCQSHNTKLNGWRYTKTGKRQRQMCLDCGAWSLTGAHIRDKK